MAASVIHVPTFAIALTILITVVTVAYGALYLAGLRYRSSQTFFLAYGACTVGVAGAFARPFMPEALSVGLCNLGVGLFLVLLHRGLAHLTDQPRRPIRIDAALVAGLVLVQLALTFVWPSLGLRIVVFSAAGIIEPLLIIRMLAAVREPALRPVIRFQVAGIALLVLINVARVPLTLGDGLTSLMSPSVSLVLSFAGFFLFIITNAVGNFAFMAARNQLALQRAATEDPLTNALNRRALDFIIERELSRRLRSRGDLAVLVLDLDDFKGINDRHGHKIGDDVLRSVADRVRGCIGGFDTLARIGGEEFVVLLPECNTHGAGQVADRILRAIRQSPAAHLDGEAISITISIGGALLSGNTQEDWPSLFDRADRALYQAKLTGRDRAVFHNEPRLRLSASL
ncbi:GGDEF domain-containing protein [Oleomonas cavernae]|uniref:diguanylate cyclase n=1 Tax=Oleomonas cavernae TaxID=2320859 RepID=A0A418WTW8_9PROT|nr:GGDEF domain-containing protein [Oleomonas cavernae]RJF94599.1 GGDEF domain-containing protein [Oleomonas cavernae]